LPVSHPAPRMRAPPSSRCQPQLAAAPDSGALEVPGASDKESREAASKDDFLDNGPQRDSLLESPLAPRMRTPPSNSDQTQQLTSPENRTFEVPRTLDNQSHKERGQDNCVGSAASEKTTRRSRKRQRGDANPDDEVDYVPPVDPQEAESLHVEHQELVLESGYRRLNTQLFHLREKSRYMNRAEAGSMASLLEALSNLDQTSCVEVMNKLEHLIPVS
jgi:hypothetical protein